MTRPWLVAALGLLAPILWQSEAKALDIPLYVQELLPANVASWPRAEQVVRTGVPLPLDAGIRSIDELGMRGSDAAQFRVLHRDPETQDIRWVLVRFLGQPNSSGLALTRGSGSFGGAELAVDEGSRIVIETGAARFEIRRDGFRFIDRAVAHRKEYILRRTQGIVVQHGGETYTSAKDAGVEIVVEENGPLEAVIRARGRLTNAAGQRHLGYTARLHFTKNQTHCRAFVTLRNGEIASLSAKKFDAAWIEMAHNLTTNRTLQYGTSSGLPPQPMAAGESAFLVQGDNDFMRDKRTVRVVSDLTSTVGLEVDVSGLRLNEAGYAADHALGWMSIMDEDQQILFGMRDFAAQFPAGFDVSDNFYSLDLFSRHNSKKDLVFSWGAHETRELLIDFTVPSTSPQVFHYDLQYPLLGRCDFEHYRSSAGVFGATELVSVQEEIDFFAAQGKSWELEEFDEGDINFTRQWSFHTTGGSNQFDKDLTYLLDWLRSGQGGHFARGRIGVLWKADGSVYHSDDFDYGDRQNSISDVDVAQPESFHGKGAGNLFDDEHPHWVCMPLYYWITGDERIREAIEDYVEYRRYRGGHPIYGAIHGGALNHFRLWSRSYRDMALGYEITQRPRYLEDLRRMTVALTRTYEVDGSRGRNLERGYFYFGKPEDERRRIHLFFLTEMNPIGVREAMRLLPSDDPLREELRDYLYGLAWFTLQEAQITESARGYPYGYYAAIANEDAGNRGDQTGILLSHGYRMSGDLRFAERARSLAWRVLVDAHEQRGSELSTHIRIHSWNHSKQQGAVLLRPEALPQEDGSWLLKWRVPPGAREYIVKYGDQPLVENLGFDQNSRTFAIDPAKAMNFWAASNLPGEPIPAADNAIQTWRTPVLPAGRHHFGLKALLDRPALEAPRTRDDARRTQEDHSVQIPVLVNDVGYNSPIDPRSLRLVKPPEHGLALWNARHAVMTYIPEADFHGNDSFQYTVSNATGHESESATVSVRVLPVNDRPIVQNDVYEAPPGGMVRLPVLSNDSDPEGDDFAIVEVDASLSQGRVEITAEGDGLLYYAPDSAVEADHFRYRVRDWADAGVWGRVAVEVRNGASELSLASADDGRTNALFQNQPNPFNPSTTITFTLEERGHTTLAIFDVRGHKLRTLVQASLAPGRYDTVWDGRDGQGQTLASGVYYYRLQSRDFVQTRRMLLVK